YISEYKNGKNLILYHKNYFGDIQSYHIQLKRKVMNDISSEVNYIIDYIIKHDRYLEYKQNLFSVSKNTM
ncbi:MAG TPA: hypothetical protein VIL89_07920, partial [Clostridia bacterium]